MNMCETQLPLSFSQRSVFTSDDLVITDSNRMAFQLINNWPNWVFPVAVLVGAQGSGKTHFASVWAQKTGALRVPRDGINRVVSQDSSRQSLLIEDIDADQIDEIGLFHLINSVKQENLNTFQATLLITARTVPSTWNLTLSDLRSRFNSATLVMIDQPDDKLLTAVAFKLFSDKQIIVSSEIIHYLVNRCERSLVSLKYVIDSIDRLALQRKRKITRSVIYEVLNMQT